MSEKEKMLSGEIYNPMDEEILKEQVVYQNALFEFNKLAPSDIEKKNKYLKEIL